MRKSNKPLVIASRGSRLAQAQAEFVGKWLGSVDPSLNIQYRRVQTEGDLKQDLPLTKAGGKGLFVKAVESVLLERQADLAVHSCKDLPAEEPPGLVIAAVPSRSDARDCLVSAQKFSSIDALPRGAKIGTASPRRIAQLLRIRPDLQIEFMRGNVETRVKKIVEDRQFDATLMAIAGLQRAGIGEHANFPIDPSVILPASCQGALALQCRTDDHVTMLRCLPINDTTASAAVTAERRLIAKLKCDCHSPVAVFVEPIPAPGAGAPRQDRDMPHFRLRARVLSPDGKLCAEVDLSAPARQIGKLVIRAYEQLMQNGAQAAMAKH